MAKMTREIWRRYVASAQEAIDEVAADHPEFRAWIETAVDALTPKSEPLFQGDKQRILLQQRACIEVVDHGPTVFPEEYEPLARNLTEIYHEKLEDQFGHKGVPKAPLPDYAGDFMDASLPEKVTGFLGHIGEKFFSGK
ncbi:MAG: hypothetical protein UV63_C0052G0005 [Microgenomates group bacterium GW2011_GWC1_43_11]|nr:MAG: hypothetical protein UV63_C0052G0005 [Microgenomates group bacterium GW2011_GWC1_43_11]